MRPHVSTDVASQPTTCSERPHTAEKEELSQPARDRRLTSLYLVGSFHRLAIRSVATLRDAVRLASSPDAPGRTRKAAKRDYSFRFTPWRQVTFFQASTGNDLASSLAETGWCLASRCKSLRGRPVRPRCAGVGSSKLSRCFARPGHKTVPFWSGPCENRCPLHSRHRPAPPPAGSLIGGHVESALRQFPFWSGTGPHGERQFSSVTGGPWPRSLVSKGGKPRACSLSRWLSKDSPPPGSCPVYPLDRHIVEPPPPTHRLAALFREPCVIYHPRHDRFAPEHRRQYEIQTPVEDRFITPRRVGLRFELFVLTRSVATSPHGRAIFPQLK
jgi:hypothetical protein